MVLFQFSDGHTAGGKAIIRFWKSNHPAGIDLHLQTSHDGKQVDVESGFQSDQRQRLGLWNDPRQIAFHANGSTASPL